ALGECLGTLEDLPEQLRAERCDDLILAAPAGEWRTGLVDLLAGARPRHLSILLLPGPFDALIGRMRYRWVSDVPLIEVIGAAEWRLHRPLKRLVDVVGALAMLAIAWPALL